MRLSAILLLCATTLVAGEAVTPPTVPPKTVAQPAAAKAYLGIAIDNAGTIFAGKGLAVLRVEPDSPAAVMGLMAGDCILTIDGTALKTQDELARFMGGRKPGDSVKIEFLRPQGKDGLAEKKEATGVLQEARRSRSANLNSQISELQTRLAELAQKSKEPTLAEVLQKLQDIEKDLPRAAEQFKKIYPNGEFRIAISLEITSDKTAKNPLAIEVGGKTVEPVAPAPAPEPAPKPEPAPTPAPAPAPEPTKP